MVAKMPEAHVLGTLAGMAPGEIGYVNPGAVVVTPDRSTFIVDTCVASTSSPLNSVIIERTSDGFVISIPQDQHFAQDVLAADETAWPVTEINEWPKARFA